MFDTSTLGLISLIIRVIGSVFLGIVLLQQTKLRFRKDQDGLNNFRNLLIALTLLPFMFNFLFAYNNYIRFTDGMQNEVVNNLSFVLGSVASTATAIVLWLLYRKR